MRSLLEVNDFIDIILDDCLETISWIPLYQIFDKKPVYYLINNNNSYAGFAAFKGYMEFNLAFFCSHPNRKDLVETIAHELAHLIQYKVYPYAHQAHGPEFRDIMSRLGYQGNTYHNMSMKLAREGYYHAQNELKNLSI